MARNQALSQLAADLKPDIIIATETWLTENHGIAKIFISDGYEIERRDREHDSHGGVIIAVKKTLIATRESELETDCEIMWCKLKLAGKKTMHIGAFYRPHENDKTH